MDIIKVTGKKENCELMAFLPFEIEKMKETVAEGVYSIYYEMQPDDNSQPIVNYLSQVNNPNATLANIKESIDAIGAFALPLGQISKLLELKIAGASILEPWSCPWNGEIDPPALNYYQCENGTYQSVEAIDDSFIQKKAEKVFSEYNTMDEDGEYFIP